MGGRRALVVLLLVGLAMVGPLVGAEDAPWEPYLDGSGYLKGSVLWAPGIEEPASTILQGGLTATLRLELDLAEYGLIVWNNEVFSNFGNLGLAGSGNSSAESLYPLAWRFDIDGRFLADLDVKELYYEVSLGDFDLRLGKQIFAWGLADGNNPTDILNARHVGTRSGASTEENKMGALALDLVYNFSDGKSKIEAVFLPYSVVNDLTIPVLTTRVVEGSGYSPNIDVALLAAEKPDWALENFEGAIRGLFFLDGFSFSLSYLNVLDRFPDTRADSYTIAGNPPITPSTVVNTQTPVYKRIHGIGLDWATTIAGFDFRGEGLLSLTEDLEGDDYLVKNPSLNGTVQVSRSWLDGGLITSLSWAPRVVFGYRAWDSYSTTEQNAVYQIYSRNGQGFEFENGLGVRIEGKFVPEVLSASLFGLYNFAAQDYLAQLGVDWVIADGLKLRAAGTLYGSLRASEDPLRAFGTFGNSSTDLRDSLSLDLIFNY